MKKIVLFLALALWSNFSTAQKLIGSSARNIVNNVLTTVDSTTLFNNPLHTSPTTQNLSEGTVNIFEFDSVQIWKTFGGNLLLLQANAIDYNAGFTQPLQQRNHNLNGSGLNTSDGITNYYYSGSLQDSFISITKDFQSNLTYLFAKNYNHFNAQNKVDTNWYWRYSTVNGAFQNIQKKYFIYNSNGLVITTYEDISTDSVNFSKGGKTEHFYDNNNNLDSSIGYLWSNANQQFSKISFVRYTYNSSNFYTSYEWGNINNNVYSPVSKTFYNRPANTEMDYSVLLNWNGTSYDSSNKTIYTYQSGLLRKRSNFNYVNSTWTQIPNFYETNYYYSNASPNSLSTNTDENKWAVFPNPCNGNFTITNKLGIDENVKISIINMNGQLVQKQQCSFLNGKTTQTIDASALPSGIYQVKVETSKGVVDVKRLEVR
jgi:hypothetical protein